MKVKTVIKLAALAVVLSVSVVGCRRGLDRTTVLPGRGGVTVTDEKPTGPLFPPGDNNTTGGKLPPETPTPIAVTPVPVTPVQVTGNTALNGKLTDMVPSADQPFKSETVYFEFDKATLRQSEIPKVERVASGIKGLAGKALRIEGHCDERGTEEYNRSLGERRALAVRESLMRAGVDPNLIDTISYGEDRPVDPGHNDSAWSKNRRGEFIVIEPASASTSTK